MAIAIVQATGTNGSGTSVALAFGSNLTAGNLSFVWAAGRTNPCTSVDDTLHGVAAYTEHVASRAANVSSVQSIRAYYKENTSSGACTVTANYSVSSDATSIAIQEISGLATSSAVDQGNNGTGNSATLSSGNITTTQADEIIFGAASQRQGGSSDLTIDADYTLQIDTGYGREFITGYRIVSATETNNFAPTSAAADDFCASVISFKAALATLTQEGYRWRDDDGNETTASWLAAQDTSVTRARGTNTRLRILIDATLDPDSQSFQLEVRRHHGVFLPVTTSSGPIRLSASGNIAAGAATNTTAQLTAPAGKNSGTDFQAGKISDDTNPITVDLGSGKYTELEWCLTAVDGEAHNTFVYDFRVTAAGERIDSYAVNPQWTIPGQRFILG